MIKLSSCPKVEKSILENLAGIEDKAIAWDNSKDPSIEAFKTQVMDQGLKIQGERCVWCMLMLRHAGRRAAERDHIAPKGIHSQWTFHPKNIAIACEFCNGSSIKGRKDTIKTVAKSYDKCEFLVVHPYLVNKVEDHLVFEKGVNGGYQGIIIRGISEQGIWTVENLKLDSPGMTVMRAQEYLYLEQIQNIDPILHELYKAAIGRA